jgi:hypothetical protein
MMRLRILELQKQLRRQILREIDSLAELKEDPEILRKLKDAISLP